MKLQSEMWIGIWPDSIRGNC